MRLGFERFGSRQCYYVGRDGLPCPMPLLLLPVEHFRRVSPLVSDLPITMIQKTAPVAEKPGLSAFAFRPSALSTDEVMMPVAEVDTQP